MAALKNGLGRVAFVQKKHADAERWYGDVVARLSESHLAPEAMYWRAVAQYSATHDHSVLGKVAEGLEARTRRAFGLPTNRIRTLNFREKYQSPRKMEALSS
jgi:hypothetical protein